MNTYGRLQLRRRQISLDETLGDDSEKTFYTRCKSKEKTEDTVLENEKKQNIQIEGKTTIQIIQECLDAGMERQEALEYVQDKLGITKAELLEIMKVELERRVEIKMTKAGEAYLGEEI